MSDLEKDLAPATVVSHVVVHLNTTIHRSGMHDNAVRGQSAGSLAGETVLQPIIRGNRPAGGTFHLDAKHDDRVKIMQIRLKIV
jgi:hypothetical protein